MSQWKLIVELTLPIPAVLLVLLCIPAPAGFRRGVLYLTKKIMSFGVFGGCQLVHLMMAITTLALLGTVHATYKTAEKASAQLAEGGILSANQKLGMLAPKWRQERNFWIAVLCFACWVLLYRLYHLLLRKEELEQMVKEYQEGKAPGGVSAKKDAAPSAPPMPKESKEEKKAK